MRTVVINSGYFNPIHPGHIECMELSRALGDELVVIVNSDHQAQLKRGIPSFQDEQFRMRVVGALRTVDRVVLACDTDGSVVESIRALVAELRQDPSVGEIIFAKGGDRMSSEVPEAKVCQELGVRIVDGLGAKTHNSSEYIVKIPTPEE